MLRMAAVGHPLTSGLRDCCNLLVESPDFQKARANRFAFFCKLAKTSALAYFCARLRVLRPKSATNANRQDVTGNFMKNIICLLCIFLTTNLYSQTDSLIGPVKAVREKLIFLDSKIQNRKLFNTE